MKLYDLLNMEDLHRGIEDKLINARASGDGQTIYNYSDAAMYTPGAWENPAVRKCRGLIIDDLTQDVVARPWEKFFGYGQVEAGDLDFDQPVEVTDKKDGSMGVIHLTPSGDIRVATRGSFESDQAIWATKWINDNWPFVRDKHDTTLYWTLRNFTLLVEIIYPGNRIVCDYGDYEGLVLLGSVDINHGFYFSPDESAFELWSGDVTEVFPYTTLKEALEAPPRNGAEGLCVRYLNEPKIVKIKQEDYVQLHRIVTGLSEKSVWEHLVAGKTLEELLAPLPDELHSWATEVYTNLRLDVQAYQSAVEAAYSEAIEELGSEAPRGKFAEKFKEYPDLMSLLFMQLDNRDTAPAILKRLKPRGDTRAKTISEETA